MLPVEQREHSRLLLSCIESDVERQRNTSKISVIHKKLLYPKVYCSQSKKHCVGV